MSWRTWVYFKPLFGDQKYIDGFYENVHGMPGCECYDGIYEFMMINGDAEQACAYIADEFKGITFYGYAVYDTTTGSDYARNVIFNHRNGLIFYGAKEYEYGMDYNLIKDDVLIRGTQMDESYIELREYEDPEFKVPPLNNCDEYGGYSLNNVDCQHCEYWQPDNFGFCDKIDRYTDALFSCSESKYHKKEASEKPVQPNEYRLNVQYDKNADALHVLFPNDGTRSIGIPEERDDGVIVMRNIPYRYITGVVIPKLHEYIGDGKHDEQ